MSKKKQSSKTKPGNVAIAKTDNLNIEAASQRSKVAEALGESQSETYLEAKAYRGPIPAPVTTLRTRLSMHQ